MVWNYKENIVQIRKNNSFGKEAFSEYTNVSIYVKADYLLLF